MSVQDVLSPPYDTATDHEVSILEAAARPRPALGEVRLPPGGRPPQQAVRGTTATDESFEGPFVRIARRYSLCDDDAWEAFARALEIIARNRHRIRHETAVAYMAVVVRNEALAVRRQRTREAPLEAAAYELTGPEIEPDEPDRDPRLPALRAAMRELRPDDARCCCSTPSRVRGATSRSCARPGGRTRRSTAP
jgi:hypothetical protein